MRINIVGTSGSGKSTLAKKIAETLGSAYIELDQVIWQPDWVLSSDEVFFHQLEQLLGKQNCWVLDGNYTRTIPIKWRHIDMVVWVDFSFSRTLVQAVKRGISRAINKKELWPGTGNKESFKRLFSRDSIILWMIRSYFKMRRKYLSLMEDPQYSHIRFIQLRSPRQVEIFLSEINRMK